MEKINDSLAGLKEQQCIFNHSTETCNATVKGSYPSTLMGSLRLSNCATDSRLSLASISYAAVGIQTFTIFMCFLYSSLFGKLRESG